MEMIDLSKKIILTGGGSAGHVTPNLALIPLLKKLGYEIEYIGTQNGIERGIIEKEHIKYFAISSGKLRRYFDIKNFTDPFKVIKGVFEARRIIKKEKPNVIFSKGGFVSVPVVIGAYLNKVPAICHESDMSFGLANKISVKFCKKICVTFSKTLKYAGEKGVVTGTPIRRELLAGSRILGLKYCRFNDGKPVLLVIGGSLGSKFINDIVRESLQELIKKYNIIHICGKNNIDEKLNNVSGYRQFEYVYKELNDLFNAADVIVSRAGANVIFELLALKKPNLLIPLPLKSSRGDQILNARYFEKCGYSMVQYEEDLNSKKFIEKVNYIYENRGKYISSMEKSDSIKGAENIVNVIEKYAKNVEK